MMGEIRLFRADQFEDLIDSLNASFQRDYGCILLLDAPLPEKQVKVIESHPGIICLATKSPKWRGPWPDYILGYLENPQDRDQLLWALESAKRMIEIRHENQQLRYKLQVEGEKLDHVLAAALQLSEERDYRKLCDQILTIMRKQVRSEGASLYLANQSSQELRFIHVQNEKVKVEASTFTLPINENSMAGACAFRKKIVHVPDVRNIPVTETFKFNDSFDRMTGYQTRSSLCIPLIKTTGDLIGVIQLINSKRDTTFTQEDLEIGKVLSAPVASALETALLYEEIERLFEGFIKASVTAIESRDPTTSGHSERVALLTVALAEEVDRCQSGIFEDIRFDERALNELRYASLLHDFGKIGVPEPVLLKENKLYPDELKEVIHRAKLVAAAHPQYRAEMQDFIQKILEANKPSVRAEQVGINLDSYLTREFEVLDEKIILLDPKTHDQLMTMKGSLSPEDRKLIESHVVHTYRFLEQIPWTRNLKSVPRIARSHHEKLDGSGYPEGLRRDQIPFESQLMAVTDIFDALTAHDRPYKKAVPVPKALDILMEDAVKSKINIEIVKLFINRRVYEVIKSSQI